MAADNSIAFLTPGAYRIIDAALRRQQDLKSENLGTFHWLLVLLERHGEMVKDLSIGIDPLTLKPYLENEIRKGNIGSLLSRDKLLESARQLLSSDRKQVSERNVARIILNSAGYETRDVSAYPDYSQKSAHVPQTPSIRAPRPIPTLEKFGVDLTLQARQGKLHALTGRDNELQLMVEVLCRRTKRNPALVGPAGTGKTAIVEGLAQKIRDGNVPELLQNTRIIMIQPSLLSAGAGVAGEFEDRLKKIISEASQEGIILFIDEFHTILSGRMEHYGLADMLKPSLARGDIACIAATTDEEFRRFIEKDSALERRFQPVRINELTPAQTVEVLCRLRDDFEQKEGVKVGDAILRWIVDFAGRFLRNRNFPDKAVDVLEQCVAYSIANAKKEVGRAEAEKVAQRMIGMPLDVHSRLEELARTLSENNLLTEENIDILISRLQVTMRGLDIRSFRPNVVVLLINEAASRIREISESIADVLFGNRDKVICLDLGSFVHESDITRLVGASPSYVGYGDKVPLHRIKQAPWSVVVFENIDNCHPAVRELIRQALEKGVLLDGQGRKMYFSDAVIILTANMPVARKKALGFKISSLDEEINIKDFAGGILGNFAESIDIICSEIPRSDVSGEGLMGNVIFMEICRNYECHGLRIAYDKGVTDWFINARDAHGTHREWERFVEEMVNSALLPFLRKSSEGDNREIIVRLADGEIYAEQYLRKKKEE